MDVLEPEGIVAPSMGAPIEIRCASAAEARERSTARSCISDDIYSTSELKYTRGRGGFGAQR